MPSHRRVKQVVRAHVWSRLTFAASLVGLLGTDYASRRCRAVRAGLVKATTAAHEHEKLSAGAPSDMALRIRGSRRRVKEKFP
jgi:hypothetical protein